MGGQLVRAAAGNDGKIPLRSGACTKTIKSAMSIVVLDSSSDLERVQEVFNVSVKIFGLDITANPLIHPADINQWTDKLANHHGEIIYHEMESGEITAFAFTYQRSTESHQIHVWIAGCDPKFRRKGIMARLFQSVEAQSVQQGYEKITVNTYPARFVNMPSFLESQNFMIANRSQENNEDGVTVEKLSYIKDFQSMQRC